MRRLALAATCLLILLAAPCLAEELYDQLAADPAKGKQLKRGLRHLEDYFKFDGEARKTGPRGAKALKKRDDARGDFFEWLAETEETLGVDLRTKPGTVIEMLGQARVKSLNRKIRKGGIEYVRVEDARGMDRLEYAYMVPKAYDVKGPRYPVILSMHGRVIDGKHPAFRNKEFRERSRQVIYNHWRGTPTAAEAVIIAPLGGPNGFTFNKNPYRDLQLVYRSLVETMKNFHVDWDRTFLEVQGSAMRAICEQTFMFAGYIVRDRVDDRARPFLPVEELFMLENLNGTPLVYVADESHWEKVGKPMADALTKAYEKAGAPDNLLILKAKRNMDTKALRGDDVKIHKFLMNRKRLAARKKFTWRFFNSGMKSPTPVEIGNANFIYDVGGPEDPSRKAPLKDKAGSLVFEVKDNVIDINITEAESLRVYLYDGLVDFDKPVTIKVNGEVMREKGLVTRDWELFWQLVVPGRFFMLPYLAKVDCDFQSKPQFQPPPPPPKEGEEGETPPGAADKGAAGMKGK